MSVNHVAVPYRNKKEVHRCTREIPEPGPFLSWQGAKIVALGVAGMSLAYLWTEISFMLVYLSLKLHAQIVI